MDFTLQSLERQVGQRLVQAAWPEAPDIAWACAWLAACGYPGVKLLAEAISMPRRDIVLARGPLGLDLRQVSCALLAPRLLREVQDHGRVFLRNVTHGLYLLPFSVRAGIGIGCPVDPGFYLGGAREKNPYAERLAAAQSAGVTIDDDSWRALFAPSN